MPEFRLDPTTGEWVIIAGERGRRPQEYVRPRAGRDAPAYADGCPFCPGNEAMTPPDVLLLPDSSSKSRWQVRVFPNKHAALTTTPSQANASEGLLFRAVPGFGIHEVLVETPAHNCFPAMLSHEETTLLVQAYQQRFSALAASPSIQYILIFKNHGERAGTSLVHPHSQIIAAPMVPENVLGKRRIAQEHHQNTGKCLYCHLVEEEVRSGARVVYDDELFLVFHPFAAARPAETWIVPRNHQPSLSQVDEPELSRLAAVLNRTLKQLRAGFSDPDLNYAIHSTARSGEHTPYLHWFLQLVPHLSESAGFELGSGININVEPPEHTAELMRRAVI